jgi:hypothetical protein
MPADLGANMFPAPAVFALYAEQLFGELGSRHCRCHDRVSLLAAACCLSVIFSDPPSPAEA